MLSKVTYGRGSSRSACSGSARNVLFEKHMHFCVFKDKAGAYKTNYFEVDPRTDTISIWNLTGYDMDGNTSKGAKIFEGTYEITGKDLWLRGQFDNEQEVLHLLKRPPVSPEN